jgi:putative transposase
MSELKIAGYTPPAFKKTTVPDTLLKDSPNIMKKSHATQLNTVWVSDITYVATTEGWLYLCVIIDLDSRKVVGWSTRKDMKVELLLEAFTRRPPGPLIFHSDKGGQYKTKKIQA